MAIPPNTTAATAATLVLNTTVTLDVQDAAAPLHEVWYTYTPVAGDIALGIFAFAAGSAYRPQADVFTGTPTALTPTGLTTFANKPLQQLLTPGRTYYVRVRNTGATEPLAAPLQLTATRASNAAVGAGAILINDDAPDKPLVVLSPTTGTVQQFRPFLSGETAAVLPSGLSLWADGFGGGMQLFDATLTRTATLPWTYTGEPPITSNGTTTFYIGDPGDGIVPARLTTATTTGTLGAVLWTLPAPGLVAMAVSRDETVLYYYSASAGAAVLRYDLLTHVSLSPLAAAVAGYTYRNTMLVLADETIVVLYTTTMDPYDAFVRRYDRTGTLLHTYPLGAVHGNHLAHALDDPASFWVWSYLRGASNGRSRIDHLRASDGTVLATFETGEFEGGSYRGPESSTPPLFGHSQCCPFVVFPPPLAPYGGPPTDGATAPATHTETHAIRRLRRAPHLAQENSRVFYRRFELDLERGVGLADGQGSDPLVLLRISRDGGQTWGEEQRMSAGALGAYTQRVIARRLGQARDTVFEVVVSDPVAWALVGAWLDLEAGDELMAAYPPYQQPIVDRATGLVSTPWQLFFLSLLGGAGGVAGAIPPGSVPVDRIENIASPRLLGRGSPGVGPVEQLTIGAGLALVGTELAATPDAVAALGYWTPITNGDPASPEILFDAAGDCVVGFVPTP